MIAHPYGYANCLVLPQSATFLRGGNIKKCLISQEHEIVNQAAKLHLKNISSLFQRLLLEQIADELERKQQEQVSKRLLKALKDFHVSTKLSS